MKFAHLTLCLASESPRRAELLQQLGIRFEVKPAEIDESVVANEAPETYVIRMAEKKSRIRWQLNRQTEHANLPVLGADTCVVLNGRIMGKPLDREHAVEMLTALSGSTHEVLTAVSIVQGEHQRTRVSRSRVTF
jgi:septum formation protein